MYAIGFIVLYVILRGSSVIYLTLYIFLLVVGGEEGDDLDFVCQYIGWWVCGIRVLLRFKGVFRGFVYG